MCVWCLSQVCVCVNTQATPPQGDAGEGGRAHQHVRTHRERERHYERTRARSYRVRVSITGREIPERGLVQHALEREILGAQKAEVLQCMRQPVVRQALSWDDNV